MLLDTNNPTQIPVMKYIWVKERVQPKSHIVEWHRVFCLRIAKSTIVFCITYLWYNNPETFET